MARLMFPDAMGLSTSRELRQVCFRLWYVEMYVLILIAIKIGRQSSLKHCLAILKQIHKL